jgi:NhaP-type Na+/H+ or K+/H+ antiporter
VTWTVLLSVILHGLTAGPLATRYGRRTAGMAPDAVELEDAVEPRSSRTLWSAQHAP